MRRIASRLLLVGLVVAVLAFVLHRAADPGGALATIEGIRAEGNPKHEVFRVDAPTRVTIEAAGSFEGGAADTALAAHGWLVERSTGRVVWQMRPARRPERGTFVLMRDTIALGPGTYDAYYAALGVPFARTVERGETLRERLSDALRGGGKGWVGDADRWRFHVRLAPGEDGDAARPLADRTPEAAGLVWGTGPARSDRLYEVVLRATEPVVVRLDAVFEGVGDVPADSAYLVSVEGDTLWVARPATARHAGGSPRNLRQTDSLALGPGRYRAVFRTDGSHATRDWDANPPWEPWRWGLRVFPADSASRAGAIKPEDLLNDLPRLVDLSCVEEEDASQEIRFEVTEALETTIVAVGEFVGSDAYDYAELLRSGETVWDMRSASRRPAGGGSKNVRADETVSLLPGTYTLRYTTDGSHQCRDYNTSPPDVENLWGVVLLSTDGEEAGDRIRLLEQTRGIPRDALARIVRVGDSETETETFELERATDVCILALGEMNESNRYDWAGLTGPTSWSMNMQNTFPAGGSTFNRMSITYLTLQPGRYTARFQTDSNHSYEEWVNAAPYHPEYWGVQIWRAPPGASDLDDPRSACIPPGVDVPASTIPPPPPIGDGSALTGEAEPLSVAGDFTRPALVGGRAALLERLAYPEDARQEGVDGTVYVQLVVEADGGVEGATCASSPDARLCEAAIAAVEASPFRPATRDGEPVEAPHIVPVPFRL